MIVTASNITNGKRARVIDAPGLDQGSEEDIEHIKKMIHSIKNTTSYVKLFVIIFNGATRGD